MMKRRNEEIRDADLQGKSFFEGKMTLGVMRMNLERWEKAKEKVGRELLTWIEDDSLVVCDGGTWKY